MKNKKTSVEQTKKTNATNQSDYPILQTRVELHPANFAWDLPEKALFLGSCFAENLGGHYAKLGLPVVSNPTGVLYNPCSIARVLGRIMNNRPIEKVEVNQNGELHFHYDFHSDCSSLDPNTALGQMNAAMQTAHALVKNIKFVALTFGTAYAYFRQDTGDVVANCHRMPPDFFRRELLTIEDMLINLEKPLSVLLKEQPDCHILCSVSPVRHMKDGAQGNQRSKARLIELCHLLCESFPGRCVYFPAYEILMDELRDYRYYDTDLLHPSALAIDIIRGRFADWLMQATLRDYLFERQQLQAMLVHRPRFKESEAYQNFRQQIQEKTTMIQTRYGIELNVSPDNPKF